VEEAPQVFGVSRVYIDDMAQLWTLEPVILQSLNILLGSSNKGDHAKLNDLELNEIGYEEEKDI
jgi:hypothetical protein